MKTAFDAAYPPATVPGGATVACIYIGGDTPNPIGDPNTVPAYRHVPYWLPVFVRSNPSPVLGLGDASAATAWLNGHGAPPTCAVVLDLETAITAGYVKNFAAGVTPHPVLPYGSRSSLMSNPPRGGYFLAWPGWTGKTWPLGVVAIQHVYAGSYDLSSIQDSVPLWKRGFATPSPSAPAQSVTHTPVPSTSPGCAVVTVRTGQHGNGWTLTGIPWPSFLAATLQGADPPVDGRYWPGSVHVQERTGRVLVSVTGCLPTVTQTVYVART